MIDFEPENMLMLMTMVCVPKGLSELLCAILIFLAKVMLDLLSHAQRTFLLGSRWNEVVFV
jgi:hypothetical protein